MIEDSDLNKIAELVRKQKSMNRWYNDPERAKRWGPITESLCWILCLITAISLLVVMVQFTNQSTVEPNNEKFTNEALSLLDCDSLRSISLSLLQDNKGPVYYDQLRQLIDSQILSRCT